MNSIKCIPKYIILYWDAATFILLKSIVEMNLKLCPVNVEVNKTIIDQLPNRCDERICKKNCVQYSFGIEVQSKIYTNISNSIISLEAESIPHIKYVHIPVMEFNKFIYNMGGIFGLWFGLSAVCFSHVFSYKQILVELNSKIDQILTFIRNLFIFLYKICKK